MASLPIKQVRPTPHRPPARAHHRRQPRSATLSTPCILSRAVDRDVPARLPRARVKGGSAVLRRPEGASGRERTCTHCTSTRGKSAAHATSAFLDRRVADGALGSRWPGGGAHHDEPGTRHERTATTSDADTAATRHTLYDDDRTRPRHFGEST